MRGLEGRTVLITRSERANAELTPLLLEQGAKVIALPAVEFVDPDSWEECDHAIVYISHYDGFFFTSRNAVERFLRRIEDINPQAKEILKKRSIYAVGEKTETTLEEAGIPVAFSPEFFSAEELVHSLDGEAIAGKRFLFPKSNIARDILPTALRELNAVVDEVVVYKNVAPQQKDLDSVRNALARGDIDVVAFFSPSAVRNFIQLMGQKILEQVAVAVIGRTTARAAEDLGIAVHIIANAPTSESLVEAISGYFHSMKEQ